MPHDPTDHHRRYGNLIENTPIFLILLAFVESAGGISWLVAVLDVCCG